MAKQESYPLEPEPEQEIKKQEVEKEQKTPEQKIKDQEEERKKMYEDTMKKIRMQQYEKFKKGRERFRNEHGIKMSEEEIEKENANARKKFGIE